MRDNGINKGLVQLFETSDRRNKHAFYGFRKMFWSYLNKMNVPFYDSCCLEAGDPNGDDISPVRTFGGALQTLVGGVWTNFDTTPPSISTDTISEQTTAHGVNIDGALIKDGGISANSMFAGFFPTTAAQALSGAGAVNVTSYLTKYTSTGGAQALTLAAGTQIGQRKKVSHVVDGGSGVLTATFVGGTTITFTTVGEFADLLWNGTAWAVLELGNTATPGTPPVLA